jgi:polysaccharide export outer membrane protein
MKSILRTLCLLILTSSAVLAQNKELPLRAGDQFGVQISGVPADEVTQISHAYRISEKGTITLLYLEEVEAAGMKPSELEHKIATLYKSKEIYTHPNITVSVDTGSKEGSRVVYVSGEVKIPGGVAYRPGLTVGKAITSAGGPTPFGRMSKVNLKRNGTLLKVLNLSGKSNDGDTSIEPEDEIIVPD